MTSSAALRNRLVIRPANTRVESILLLSIPTPIGRVRLAAHDRALVRIELPGAEADERMNVWLALQFPEATRRHGVNPILRKAASQLEAYFTGGLRSFSLALELAGTDFQRAVWSAVGDVPFGATVSYGEVAAAVCRPRAVRAVGAAQAANPIPIVIPCHRVIGCDGALTGYGGGLGTKQWLIEHEQALRDLPAALGRTAAAAPPAHTLSSKRPAE